MQNNHPLTSFRALLFLVALSGSVVIAAGVIGMHFAGA